MDEYVRAFRSGAKTLPDTCDLTGLYGRITKGRTESDFVRLSTEPYKRLSWIVDHETLREFLGMSHLDILIHSGHTLDWIRYQLDGGRKFKLLVFSVDPLRNDQIKLATWDNILDLMSQVYSEIDSTIWSRHRDDLKRLTFDEIDPNRTIISNYYLGRDSEHYMRLDRFLTLKDPPTLSQVRAFLHHEIALNELFQGDGRTKTHEGIVSDKEYLTRNRPLTELLQYVLIDLDPILPQ